MSLIAGPLEGARQFMALEFRSLFPGAPPWCPVSSRYLVPSGQRLAGRLAESVAFGTDVLHLKAMGMKTLISGLGDITQAVSPMSFRHRTGRNPRS